MSTKGYGSYRGRTPAKRFFKVLGVILVVLILLGIAAGVYLQQFLVISDDGVRLDLPGSTPEAVSPTPDLPPMDLPVIETPEPTPTPTPTPAPSPTPEPDSLAPVLLPVEALYDGTVISRIETAGGDGALFDMKTNMGDLNFVSAVDHAIGAGVNPSSPERNAAIRLLTQTEDLYTVARVSCFKDHNLILYDSSFAIFTNSGYRWDDDEGVRWSSPTTPATRDYLTALCVELAQLGFDEILLDNAGYPDRGVLARIKKGDAYDASQFSTVIDGFYGQVALALADYDVKLSVVTTQAALDGTDTLTGQTPENLARMDRLWMYDESGILTPVTESSISSIS